MKEEKDKLIEGFRSRMKDYSEPVPAALWDSLEKELAIPVRRVHPLRYVAAAIAAVLVVASSLVWWYVLDPIEDYVAEEIPDVSVGLNAGIAEPVQPKPESVLALQTDKQVAGKSKVELKTEKKNVKAEDEAAGNKVSIADEVLESALAEENSGDLRIGHKEPVDKQNSVNERSYRNSYRKVQPMEVNKKKVEKWSVGVSVTNGGTQADHVNVGFNTFAKKSNAGALSLNSPEIIAPGINAVETDPTPAGAHKNILYNSIRKEAKTDIKHKMPVAFGASFRYSLSKNFALETGLTYTMLSSELRAGTDADYWLEDQKLHYLGIPLRANWTFLHSKYVTLYLSGGGALEKAVSGEQSTDYFVNGEKSSSEKNTLRVKPVQWSVGAAAGIQYNATKHLGIYVEPGVVHYFDDGTDVQTIRKEKPTNFNLQMGLRFTY